MIDESDVKHKKHLQTGKKEHDRCVTIFPDND